MTLDTQHWQRQYPSLNIQGKLKTSPEDFQVKEILGYEPTGEGEHIYVWVEKNNLNTAYVAEYIAKFTRLPLRNISYAGRKDKYAQTFQWFGVHLPGKKDIDWSTFNLDGVIIHHSQRHNKKLKVGNLKGNQFNITIRELSQTEHINERLEMISNQGVPNYFGSQRFGDTRYHPNGGNLNLAEKLIAGEQLKNRNKRSMAISALRSWLFNQTIHQRIINQTFSNPIAGDVMQLSGSNSIFCTHAINQEILDRLAQQDIFITAPLWGEGKLSSSFDCLTFETQLAQEFPEVTETLTKLGLKQERRPIQLFPQNMHWTINQKTLNIQFNLPSGSFATSVLREVLDLSEATHQPI